MNYTTERILGLQKVLEDNGINVRAAAKALGEDIDEFLIKVMQDIDALIERSPNIKESDDGKNASTAQA